MRHLIQLFLGCAALASGQQTPHEVIRTTTRLVQVSVVATGNDGAPVADLTQSDFLLNEDGKPQQIRVFSVDKGEQSAAGRELPAGFFSNRLEHHGGVPNSVTAILVDLLNTPPGYFGRARPALEQFLRKTDPRFRTALYSLNRGGLRVLHDFTTDTTLLKRRISEIREARAAGLSEEALQALTSMANSSEANQALAGSGASWALISALIAWPTGLRRTSIVTSASALLSKL